MVQKTVANKVSVGGPKYEIFSLGDQGKITKFICAKLDDFRLIRHGSVNLLTKLYEFLYKLSKNKKIMQNFYSNS
jgi:hypothetical protein